MLLYYIRPKISDECDPVTSGLHIQPHKELIMPIGDASKSVRFIGKGFTLLIRNGSFLLGFAVLTLSDLFLGQTFYNTLFLGVDDNPIFSGSLSFITPRWLIAFLVSAMTSMFQMITYNALKNGGNIKGLDKYRKRAVRVVFAVFVIDMVMNFGGVSILTGGAQPGSVMPVEPTATKIALGFMLSFIATFGIPIADTFMGLDEPMTEKGRQRLRAVSSEVA